MICRGGWYCSRPYKSAICSHPLIGAAGKTAPRNGYQPPLKTVFYVVPLTFFLILCLCSLIRRQKSAFVARLQDSARFGSCWSKAESCPFSTRSLEWSVTNGRSGNPVPWRHLPFEQFTELDLMHICASAEVCLSKMPLDVRSKSLCI